MKIDYKKSYIKSFSKLDNKIKKKAIERIALFMLTPLETVLNNHSLV